MAGGMNERGSYGSMADRLAATRDAQATRDDQAADDQPTQPPSEVRHVWITTGEGRVAGLLIEWRHDPDAWFGRCVFPRGRMVVEDWVPAAQLERA